MERYLQYIDTQWWGNIEKRDIEAWISNFDSNDELPKIILEHIIFYNKEQLKAYTRVLINRLKNRVYMECVREGGYLYINDDVLFSKWNNFLDETKVIPAAKRGSPVNSAYQIIRYWRSTIDERHISDLDSIGNLYDTGVRRFIFVDDFSGSGKQMIDFLKTEVQINGKTIEIGRVTEIFPEIEIIVALYVIHKQSAIMLEREYPAISWMAVDVLDERSSFLNEESYIYNGLSKEQIHKCIDTIEEINKRIMNENDEFRELSSYVLNIPIVFEHGCPNNALLLLFAHTETWKRLFKRGAEI